MEPDLESSVVDWAIDYPQTVRVFEELQIEYCCGGKSLEYACRQRGLDPSDVLEKLRRSIREQSGEQR